MKKLLLKAFMLVMLMCVSGGAWAETVTETFEKQTTGSSYNGQITYEASASNAGISWYVEHGTVSTSSCITGTKSMHMRAYYAKNSAAGTWNGALPYTETKTPIKGLESFTFNAAVSNTNLKMDVYYSTDGSSWTQIGTTKTFSNTTAGSAGTFNIPSSNPATNYYIKIAASSSSTHAANPNSTGNYTFRIDDVAFTYTAASTAYTVTFDGNSHGTPASASIKEASAGAGITLPGCTADAGYSFKGWADAADATSANVGAAGASYNPTDDVTLYAYYVPTYTLSITQPAAGGTLTVSDANGTLASGATVEVGTDLTCEVTNIPEGKRFSRFYVTYDGGENKYKNTNPATFDNLPTEGITAAEVTVTYMDVPQYTVTYKVFGNTVGTEDVYENNSIANAPTPSVDGWTLTGWTTDASYVSSETAPSIFNSPITSDVVLHAVFSQSTGNGPGTATLTNKEICDNLTNSYATGSIINSYGIWNYNAAKQGNYSSDGEYFMQLRNNATVSYLQIPEVSGNITSIVLGRVCNTSKAKYTGSIYFRETAANDATAIATATQETALTDVTLEIPAGYSTGYVMVSAACRIESVTVNYVDGVTTYTIADPRQKATITLNAACHDTDGMVYGTFSYDKPWVVPEDLIVSEISVADGGVLSVESYTKGDVVPANTGVLVSATEGGDYPVIIETDPETIELAESVLGANNALVASSVPMDDNTCEYFRLTMHNGTTIGFYWGEAAGGAFDAGTNKAYLKVAKSVLDATPTGARTGLWFGDNEEALEAVEMNAATTIYTLNGVKVNELQKGLNIVNGKKVMVK